MSRGLDIIYVCMLFFTDTAHGGIEMSDQDFRERVLESLSRIEAQAKENSTRLGTLERDVGWIKGKLEGSQEASNKVLSVITKVLSVLTLCTAVGAAIIALIALLT